jgi:hypothetical protein
MARIIPTVAVLHFFVVGDGVIAEDQRNADHERREQQHRCQIEWIALG